MKKYIAIGYFFGSKDVTSVATTTNSIKDFREECKANGFVPWVIISEKKMEILKNVSDMELFDEVTKMTTNYRKWDDIIEYIEQCFDIMEEKMAKA